MLVQARPRTTIPIPVVVGHSRRGSVQEYWDRSRAPVVAAAKWVRVLGAQDWAGHKLTGKFNPKNWRSSKSKKKVDANKRNIKNHDTPYVNVFIGWLKNDWMAKVHSHPFANRTLNNGTLLVNRTHWQKRHFGHWITGQWDTF